MSLNVKSLVIDTDEAITIYSLTNTVVAPLNFVRGNEYVLQGNCYANSYSSTIATFDPTDTWALYIGRTYNPAASPVVVITDANKFNNASDWSQVNVAAGAISARVNVNGTALDTDIANASSQTYTFQLVATNNVGGKVMVTDVACTINNAVQI